MIWGRKDRGKRGEVPVLSTAVGFLPRSQCQFPCRILSLFRATQCGECRIVRDGSGGFKVLGVSCAKETMVRFEGGVVVSSLYGAGIFVAVLHSAVCSSSAWGSWRKEDGLLWVSP
jgi:hypothetical protein